jgi:hypothetical protein
LLAYIWRIATDKYDKWLSRICRGKGQMWGYRACGAGPIPPHLETTPGIPRDPDKVDVKIIKSVLILFISGQLFAFLAPYGFL